MVVNKHNDITFLEQRQEWYNSSFFFFTNFTIFTNGGKELERIAPTLVGWTLAEWESILEEVIKTVVLYQESLWEHGASDQ